MSYLLVFVGGGLGATLRHFINLTCARCMGTGFPWGTFIINITGSTVMGLIAGYLAFKGEASQPWRLFVMTGVLGGYTTFSTYMLDARTLLAEGRAWVALAYVAATLVTGLLAVWVGVVVGRTAIRVATRRATRRHGHEIGSER